MITFIRRWSTSWPVLVLLGLILVAFAVTGVGDPFGARQVARGSVAKVGGKTITEADLLQTFDRAARNARAQNPTLSQTQMAKEGAVGIIAGQLIGQTAMAELAARHGIVASDRAVGAVIAGIPAFQLGGKFDEATYRRVLSENRLSDKELRDNIAGDVVRKAMLTAVNSALSVPAGMAEPYARLLIDTHRGSAALVPPAVTAPPTEAEITRFYAANKLRFTSPERRAYRYAVIDRAAIAAGITVADADIAAAFAKDPVKYGAAPTRQLEQVVVADEAKAKAIAAAAAREGFAAAAQRLAGFGAADIALGAQTQADFAKAASPAAAAAAFALPAGGITPPIKTAFGWNVVRVVSIGGAGKTLAEVRPVIAAELKARATDAALAALVAKFEDGVDAGKSFADLAKETGLSIVTQTPVGVDGHAPGAPPLAAEAVPIAAKAFRHEPGDGAAVEDLGGGRLVAIETTQVLPPALQKLDAVRAEATAAAARQKALAAAKALADMIAAEVRKGKDLDAALASHGLPASKPLVARRIDINQQQNVPAIVQALLATPAKATRVLPGPDGWVIIHVAAVEPGELKSVPGLLDAGRREIASQLPEEFSLAFAHAAERDVGVKRNLATIDAVTRRLSGLDRPAQ